MARISKLKRFADILNYPHVYENYDPHNAILLGHKGEEINLKGSWNSKHFQNNKPLVLELACGRGEYSVALAKKYPDKNFVGVDIKGARIWQGATIALKEDLKNVAFLRTRIEIIDSFIDKDEIDEVWITFPDPFLRDSKSNRRLTSHYFLNKYKQILKPDHVIHLKTDSPELYEFSLESIGSFEGAEIIYQKDDIYAQELENEDLEIKTYYERMHLENDLTIKYIRFRLEV